MNLVKDKICRERVDHILEKEDTDIVMPNKVNAKDYITLGFIEYIKYML